MLFERRVQELLVSTDKTLLQIDLIHEFLSSKAYWCLGIPKETVVRGIEGSLCFGLYKTSGAELLQIGYARVVTDHATFAWLCDVYIEEEYRSQGMATWLVGCVMEHPVMKGLRRMCLATKDAHMLYAKFGFEPTRTPQSWMEIKDDGLYRWDNPGLLEGTS